MSSQKGNDDQLLQEYQEKITQHLRGIEESLRLDQARSEESTRVRESRAKLEGQLEAQKEGMNQIRLQLANGKSGEEALAVKFEELKSILVTPRSDSSAMEMANVLKSTEARMNEVMQEAQKTASALQAEKTAHQATLVLYKEADHQAREVQIKCENLAQQHKQDETVRQAEREKENTERDLQFRESYNTKLESTTNDLTKQLLTAKKDSKANAEEVRRLNDEVSGSIPYWLSLS